MRIAVTGAYAFSGKYMARRLLDLRRGDHAHEFAAPFQSVWRVRQGVSLQLLPAA